MPSTSMFSSEGSIFTLDSKEGTIVRGRFLVHHLLYNTKWKLHERRDFSVLASSDASEPVNVPDVCQGQQIMYLLMKGGSPCLLCGFKVEYGIYIFLLEKKFTL